MSTTPEQLRNRTKDFALRIVRLFRSLPRSAEAQVMGRQLFRSGTSVEANYRAACRSRSRAEFSAKLGIVVEEADESAFWLELLAETGTFKKEKIESLLNEARELTMLCNASRTTIRRN